MFHNISYPNGIYIGSVCIISYEVDISGFIVVWNRAIGNFLAQKITQRLPSFLQIPDQKILFWYDTLDIKIVLSVCLTNIVSVYVINCTLDKYWNLIQKIMYYILNLIVQSVKPGVVRDRRTMIKMRSNKEVVERWH